MKRPNRNDYNLTEAYIIKLEEYAHDLESKAKQFNDKLGIGTVEPVHVFKSSGEIPMIDFINGAIQKYGKDKKYHSSIIEYIKNLIA